MTTAAASSTSASRRRSRWRARKALVQELAPLRERALEGHPWREWADAMSQFSGRMPGGQSRWSAGKDLSWEPLRVERVCEVKYDHMQGDRFRHAARFLRWRPDKPPADCRYDQLEVTPAYELARVFDRSAVRVVRRVVLRRVGCSAALAPRFSLRFTAASHSAAMSGPASGSSASCSGRIASGTCCRLTRIRVHV